MARNQLGGGSTTQANGIRRRRGSASIAGCVLLGLSLIVAACSSSGDTPKEQATSCVAAPGGLAGWWTFDEPVQGVWEDQVGTNDLTEGATTLVQANSAGKVAGAVEIPAGAYLKTSTTLSPGTKDFSLDAWVRIEAPDKAQTIVGSSDKTTGSGFWLGTDGTNWQLQLSSSTGSSEAFTSQATITPGQWHFVAVTVNIAKAEVQFVIDGTAETPAQKITQPKLDFPNPGTTAIGYDPYASTANTTTISIDELEYFERALDPQELLDINTADTNGKCKQDAATTAGATCSSVATPGSTLAIGTPVDFTIQITPPTASATTIDWSAKHDVSGTKSGSGKTYTYTPTSPGKVKVSAKVVVGSETFNVTCGTFEIGTAATQVAICTPSVALPHTFAVGDTLGLSASLGSATPPPTFTWTFSPSGPTLNGPTPSYTFTGSDAGAIYSVQVSYTDPTSNLPVTVTCGDATVSPPATSLTATCEPTGLVGEIAPGVNEVAPTSLIAATVTPSTPTPTVTWTAENLATNAKTTYVGNPVPGSFFADPGEYKLTAAITNGTSTTTLDCGVMVNNR